MIWDIYMKNIIYINDNPVYTDLMIWECILYKPQKVRRICLGSMSKGWNARNKFL